MNSSERAARTVVTLRTDVCNVDPTISIPASFSGKDEDAVSMLVTDEADEFLMETEDIRLAKVEIQCIIESASDLF